MSVTDGDGPASQDERAFTLQIYPRLSLEIAPCCTLQVTKEATAAAVVKDVATSLSLDPSKNYVLVEVKECGGEEWVLEAADLPVQRVLLWPRKAQDQHPQSEGFYFLLQERNHDGSIRYVHLPPLGQEQQAKHLVARGFLPPRQEDVDDLCNLPNLNETSILDNLRNRFHKKKIYTFAGTMLIAINPFKFLPIYNPKYVKMYQNHQIGKLEPHIFAIADVAYYAMLRKHVNQCIVISGESGSGKTQSTNFLIHCLTALSQKGYASGVERTILGAGPVLEAFGNAKTAHNDNSSRFGKFIQVNYLESGVVRGAVVEKYLLEKSRLVSRAKNERNYHVFYYLLVGASAEEREEFKLLEPEDYFYLKQQKFTIEDADDLRHDFERLQLAMEMVGFLPATKKQIFSVLSAILYLGNVAYMRKSNDRDEGLEVGPPEVLTTLSDLLKVKPELLVEALTKRKTVTVNDKLILPYSHSEAVTARDSVAKSLYSALFDWIVLRINHALLNKRDMEESVSCLSIGVLDIFGFEDFQTNSFEQFCINYANEQLHYYFNQHIFKLEQEEYQAEGITWHNIDYTDNVGCIHLVSRKPTGLLYLLDEESNFPHATDKTLLDKFKQQHHSNKYFVATPVMEPAFVIRHFAGKVKYQIKDFREKNTDHMRPDIVALLRSSDRAFVRQLIGMGPVAMFRWGILRATIRAMAAFNEAGRRWAATKAGVVRPNSRVPLGELQRSNKPNEKIYRRGSVLEFSFDHSEERPLEAFEDIFASFESKNDMHAQIINSIKGLRLDGEDPRKLLQSWGRLRFPRHVLQKNKCAKHKQLIPKNLLDSRSLKFIVSLTLHDRTTKSLLHLHKKKKPPSISAQFQASLSKLLETLGRAEPFFIRCLRSNAEKREMLFDQVLILQQLRYTGMLETVCIRRSGYSAKYTHQEFLARFRVLLPKNSTGTQEEIAGMLQRMGLDNTTYQIGKTKVFLKEPERHKLQDALHKDVMRKIVFLQRWFRAKVARRNFVRMREAAVSIQRSWRAHREKRRSHAAKVIQASWRSFRQRSEYLRQRAVIQRMQALVRGKSARRRCLLMKEEKRKRAEEEEAKRRMEEEEEAARLEAERLAKEAEEAAQREREAEEEAARREKEMEEEREAERRTQEEAERQTAEGECEGEGQSEGQVPDKQPMSVETHEENGTQVDEEKEAEVIVENGPEVVASDPDDGPEVDLSGGPEKGVPSEVDQLEDQDTNEAANQDIEPAPSETTGTSTTAADAAVPPPQKPSPPQLPKPPAPSRSLEKREQRRQRGLEHNQRESERAASAAKDEPAPPKQPAAATGPAEPHAKPKERADGGELDRYVFQAWKGEKGKKETKGDAGGPARPSTLALDLAAPQRNGHEAPASPTGTDAAARSGTAKGSAGRRKGHEMDNASPEPTDHDKRDQGTLVSPMSRGETTVLDSQASAPPREVKARNRKRPKRRRRRLAFARSCLAVNSTELEDSWRLHAAPYLAKSQSVPDIASESSRAMTPRRRMLESPSHQDLAPPLLQPSTPERSSGFLKKILKKRAHKEAQTPEDGDLTMAAALAERAEVSSPSQHSRSDSAGGRPRSIKISRATRVSEQWNASLDREITNTNELRHLDEFLANQVNDLRSREKLSDTESIFLTATMQFRENIKSMYCLSTNPHTGYKGLMRGYQSKVISLAGEKRKGEVPLVVNLFQSVLDGFIRGEIKREEAEPVKPSKGRKKRRKKNKSMETLLDHMFVNYQVSIMQSCDQCSSYIWGMEKAYMCSYCKMVCHKKCLSKIVMNCSTFCSKKHEEESGNQHFGVRVCHLINDKTPVPIVLEILLEHVEMNGLYTEGIYRKSGSANRMKELYQLLETDPSSVCLEDYPIHAVTGLVKQWLRELPDPLMTFTLYQEFLHAVELPEKQEQLRAIYEGLEQLPPANFNTLQRLIFHLVRVSKQEPSNRMSPNSLAIVFAPCILRCPDNEDPLLSMKDVAKTTTCVEMVILEQIKRYNERMDGIEQLEYAETLAVNQLMLNRQNTIREKSNSDLCVVPENEPIDSETEAERNLVERIKSIKEEKEELACRLPDLEQPGSDQENLDSDPSLSSESLLDERSVCSDTEVGAVAGATGTSKPACPPKPYDLTQRSKPAADASSPPARQQLQRRHPIIPGTVKLPAGVVSHPAVRTLPPHKALSLTLFPRRENPGRRKNSVQSLYISAGAAPFSSPPSTPSSTSSTPPSFCAGEAQSPSAKAQRRYSDPDIPYAEEKP